LIRDDLTLDGTPTLNLASFVTTYMEDEAEKLMVDAFSKNFIDYEEYPVTADIQNRCVSMIARLFNAPTHEEECSAMGTSTIGSSEAIMLGVLAMKKVWQNKRKAAGKPYDKPNLIMNAAVQVCWEKAARYFDVEEKVSMSLHHSQRSLCTNLRDSVVCVLHGRPLCDRPERVRGSCG
jgi:glutamate decarboxylase